MFHVEQPVGLTEVETETEAVMKTLQELSQEVARQNESKKDFAADTRQVVWTPDGKVGLRGVGEFTPTKNFTEQVAGRLEIPRQYFQRMQEDAPTLLAQNVNHWFNNQPEKRMVRTLDGKARAFLSSRYRTLDNFDMLGAVLPALQDNNVEFVSNEVTETRMYLKVLFPKVQAEIKVGDVVRAGLVVSNSEVGAGSFKVEPFTFRLVCSNGMISEHVLSKYHVGRGFGDVDSNIREILTDATRNLDDRALFAKVRDIVRHSLTTDAFMANVARFQEATKAPITGAVDKVVEVTKKKFGFSDRQGQDILRHLITGGDLSKWGLANAVTRTAQDQEDYDDQTFFERAGGKVIELPRKDWEAIASAN